MEMEIEKAIYELYAAINSDSMTEEPSNEAMELAITALRSQQEREKCSYLQPCGWCSNFDKPCDAVCGRRLKEARDA